MDSQEKSNKDCLVNPPQTGNTTQNEIVHRESLKRKRQTNDEDLTSEDEIAESRIAPYHIESSSNNVSLNLVEKKSLQAVSVKNNSDNVSTTIGGLISNLETYFDIRTVNNNGFDEYNKKLEMMERVLRIKKETLDIRREEETIDYKIELEKKELERKKLLIDNEIKLDSDLLDTRKDKLLRDNLKEKILFNQEFNSSGISFLNVEQWNKFINNEQIGDIYPLTSNDYKYVNVSLYGAPYYVVKSIKIVSEIKNYCGGSINHTFDKSTGILTLEIKYYTYLQSQCKELKIEDSISRVAHMKAATENIRIKSLKSLLIRDLAKQMGIRYNNLTVEEYKNKFGK